MRKHTWQLAFVALALGGYRAEAAPPQKAASVESDFDRAWDDVVSGTRKVARAGDMSLERVADGAIVAWRTVEKAERSAAQRVDDTATLTAIKARLVADPSTSARAIDVDVADGVVTLRGDVRGPAEAKTAVRLALQTSGVNRVVSRLRWAGMTNPPTPR